jgi:hypothetical protein
MAERWASIGAWLEYHGLSKHAALIEAAEIDLEVRTTMPWSRPARFVNAGSDTPSAYPRLNLPRY